MEIDLERQVGNAIEASLGPAVQKYIQDGLGYGRPTPLSAIIDRIFARQEAAIESTLSDAVARALSGTIRERMVEAVEHKVAKCLISKMEGEIEKVANNLRSDPAFRARLTLAITDVVSEVRRGGGN